MPKVSAKNQLTVPVPVASRRRTAREAPATLGVTVHRPTEAVAVVAARLRAEHPINLSGAHALATAERAGASLVTFDQRPLRTARAQAAA